MIFYDPRQFGLSVAGKSGNEVMVLCPFHNDHNASAEFNIVSGLFYCFKCGASYNIKQLALALDVDVDELPVQPVFEFEENDDIDWVGFLNYPLALDHPYLAKRGVTNEQVKKHQILKTTNGVGFIIRDVKGRVVGFQERTTVTDKKLFRYYTYGDIRPFPYTNLYSNSDRVYIVEGIFGALNAERNGETALACLSASNAKRFWEHFQSIKGKVIIFFDNDDAGYFHASLLMKVSKGVVGAILPGGEADEMSCLEWKNMNRRIVSNNFWDAYKYIESEELRKGVIVK